MPITAWVSELGESEHAALGKSRGWGRTRGFAVVQVSQAGQPLRYLSAGGRIFAPFEADRAEKPKVYSNLAHAQTKRQELQPTLEKSAVQRGLLSLDLQDGTRLEVGIWEDPGVEHEPLDRYAKMERQLPGSPKE